MDINTVQQGDCLNLLQQLPSAFANLIYLDPPFFTQRKHVNSTRDGKTSYAFDDTWGSAEDYLEYLTLRLAACKKVLRSDGSIFVHCDRNSTHILRQALELTFGEESFQSEIIWSYKRWSNAKRGLLQQHQNILFYSKSANFKWNPVLVDYSATTNVDQILQKRSRDDRGKAVYATDSDGKVIYGNEKRGVPLGDVWDIPFLNPKAKERCGYPTQKPLLLLERIISLTTDEKDVVIDPFCGSGTTLVAAKLLGRCYLGMDILPDAVSLSESRLASPVRTDSALLRDGENSYRNDDPWTEAHLAGLSFARVQRNFGADAILKKTIDGRTVLVRVQRKEETLISAVNALENLIMSKGEAIGFVIATGDDLFVNHSTSVKVLPSPALQISRISKNTSSEEQSPLLFPEDVKPSRRQA